MKIRKKVDPPLNTLKEEQKAIRDALRFIPKDVRERLFPKKAKKKV